MFEWEGKAYEGVQRHPDAATEELPFFREQYDWERDVRLFRKEWKATHPEYVQMPRPFGFAD